MKKTVVVGLIKKYLLILLGCIIYSLGVALFLDVNKLASGGVTGIAIILNYLIDLPWLNTGIIIVIINVPLFVLGAVFFGKNFILSTIITTVVSSLLIELWNFVFITKLQITLIDDLLISALFGGALYGAGIGIIFRMGSTTGGTDIIIKILRKKFRYIRTGVISMVIDLIIVMLSAIIFRDVKLTCYTVISIVIFTVAFDWVLYGGNSAKLVYIITSDEKSKLICEGILKELDITATYVDGEGAYTGTEKRIILCAIKNFSYPKLRDIVKKIDPNAFTIVTSAKEIYGEGYKKHTDEDL